MRNIILHVYTNDGDQYFVDDEGALVPYTSKLQDYLFIANGNIHQHYKKGDTAKKELSPIVALANQLNADEFYKAQFRQTSSTRAPTATIGQVVSIRTIIATRTNCTSVATMSIRRTSTVVATASPSVPFQIDNQTYYHGLGEMPGQARHDGQREPGMTEPLPGMTNNVPVTLNLIQGLVLPVMLNLIQHLVLAGLTPSLRDRPAGGTRENRVLFYCHFNPSVQACEPGTSTFQSFTATFSRKMPYLCNC